MSVFVLKMGYELQLLTSFVDIDRQGIEYLDSAVEGLFTCRLNIALTLVGASVGGIIT